MARNHLIFAAGGMLLLASPAMAADPVVETARTGPSWTGFYIGVHGGVAAGDLGYTILPVLLGDDQIDYRFADQTFAYGVHGGFDYQFLPRWVGGIEIDYTQLSAKYAPFASGGFGTLAETRSSYSVTGRLGYLFTPETLVYLRAGYSGTKLETEEGIDGTSSGTAGGLLVGAGVETFLWKNMTGRIDVSYVDPSGEYENADAETFEPRNLLVTAGLSWRFGANERAREIAPGPEMSFSGPYIGAAGGYGFGRMDFDIDVPGATVGPFGEQSPSGSVFGGYDFRFGSGWVAGIAGEASYLHYEFNDPSQNSLDPSAPTLFATVDALFAVTGRLGYMANGSTLAYVKGGYSGLLTEAKEDFFALDGGEQKLLSAYQVGAGVETALTEHFSLRVEGLYTKAVDDLTVTNSQLQQNSLKPSLLTGTVGIAYRF